MEQKSSKALRVCLNTKPAYLLQIAIKLLHRYLIIFCSGVCMYVCTCSYTTKFLTYPFSSFLDDHFIPEFRSENVIKADFIVTNWFLFGLFFLLNGKMARTHIQLPLWKYQLILFKVFHGNVFQVGLLLSLYHHSKCGQRSKDFKNTLQEFLPPPVHRI